MRPRDAPRRPAARALLAAGAALLAGAALGAGCGAATRPTSATLPPDEPFDAEAETRRNEPTSIAGWEARQRELVGGLARLTGSPAVTILRQPQDVPAAGGGGGQPGRAPAAVPAARPGPAPPVAEPDAGGRPKAKETSGLTIRCQRICRHVRAICHAADRICRIAERLADGPSAQACRRGRDRCADAQAVARPTCPTCQPGARRGARERRRRNACMTVPPAMVRALAKDPRRLDFAWGL